MNKLIQFIKLSFNSFRIKLLGSIVCIDIIKE